MHIKNAQLQIRPDISVKYLTQLHM